MGNKKLPCENQKNLSQKLKVETCFLTTSILFRLNTTKDKKAVQLRDRSKESTIF